VQASERGDYLVFTHIQLVAFMNALAARRRS
jgi:hypothetical protein